MQSNIPGFACTNFKGIMFELPLKYETIKLIGKGTYGSVISARHSQTGEQIAIKKLSHVEDLVGLFRFKLSLTFANFLSRLTQKESSARL
jgi:serine/threonine protein kinase